MCVAILRALVGQYCPTSAFLSLVQRLFLPRPFWALFVLVFELVGHDRVCTLQFGEGHRHHGFGCLLGDGRHSHQRTAGGGRGDLCSSPDVRQVFDHMGCDRRKGGGQGVRVEAVVVSQALYDLVMAANRSAEEFDLTIWLDGISSRSLHQHVLPEFCQMLVEIGDVVEGRGQNVLHLIQCELVDGSILRPDRIDNLT